MNRFVIAAAGALAALVCLPGIASAHTGSVRCDATGVVFSYNANFERDTLVYENVGAALRIVTVHRNTASSDTWAGVTGTIVVSASWAGGGIAQTTLVCPPAPPPVFTTPPPPAAPSAPPAPPVAPPAVPVAPPVAPPVQLPPPAKCPPKYKLHVTHGTRLCLRTIVKRPPPPRCVIGHRVKLVGGYVCIVRVPAAPKPRGGGGTTG